MYQFKNSEFPESLKELIELVRNNINIRNPVDYRVYCREYNYPPYPEYTYHEDGKDRGEINYLMFPRSYPQVETGNRERPINVVSRKEVRPIQRPLGWMHIPDHTLDSKGFRSKVSLMYKLRICNIYTKYEYDEYKTIFTDWPEDPKDYYNNWTVW